MVEPLPRKLAPPIRNELRPTAPIVWQLPAGAQYHKVRNDETWSSVGAKYGLSAQALMKYNFGLDVTQPHGTDIVNWYLRNYVGCNVSKDGGRNWAFSNSADPGIIFAPFKPPTKEQTMVVTPELEAIFVTVPEYDDKNILDVLSKGLDIYGAGSMGFEIATQGILLPVAVDVGLIVGGAITGVVGPLVAIGGPYADILKAKSRFYFFEGFAYGFVMAANSATTDYILTHHELKYPPLEPTLKEKAESMRKLHNWGIRFGIKKAKALTAGQRAMLFTWILQRQVPASERDHYGPSIPWRDWSATKIKEYYRIGASAVRRRMVDNSLTLRIEQKDL